MFFTLFHGAWSGARAAGQWGHFERRVEKQKHVNEHPKCLSAQLDELVEGGEQSRNYAHTRCNARWLRHRVKKRGTKRSGPLVCGYLRGRRAKLRL